jgi:hypothetical protein
MSIVPDPPEKPMSKIAMERRERQRAIADSTWKKSCLNSLSRFDMTDFSLLNGLMAPQLKPEGNGAERLQLANRLREEGLAKVAKWDAQGGLVCLQRALATVQALLREGIDNTVEVGVRIKDQAPKETLLSQKKLPMKARELQLKIECDIVGARLRTLGPKRLGKTVPVDPFSMSVPASQIPSYSPKSRETVQLLSSANLAPPTPLLTARRSNTPLPSKPNTAMSVAFQAPRSRTPSPWVDLGTRPVQVPALHIQSRRQTPLLSVRESPPTADAAAAATAAAPTPKAGMDNLAETNMRLMEENRMLRKALENSKRNSRASSRGGTEIDWTMGNDYQFRRRQGY